MSEAGNAEPAALDRAASALPIPVDRISELYHGEVFAEETAEVARRRIHWMCSQCEGDSVLDIGCSQGITCLLLAREGMVVTGLDSHPEAMAYAREAASREIAAVRERIQWIEGDLANLVLDSRFDTLLMGEVIEHQAMPERFLARALKFAKPGARIVLTTPFGLHPHPDHKVSLFPHELAQMAVNLSLVVELLDVTEGYMRLIARTARHAAGEARVPAPSELLITTAQATLASQSALYERIDARSEAVRKRSETIKTLQKQVADALKAAKGADATAVTKLATAEREQVRATALLEAQRTKFESMQASLARLTQQELDLKSDLQRLRGERESDRLDLQKVQLHAEQLSNEAALRERESRELRLIAEHQSRMSHRMSEYARRSTDRFGGMVLQQSAAVQSVRSSMVYRIGESIATGTRSPRAFLGLPSRLMALVSERRRRQPHARAVAAIQADSEQTIDRFLAHYHAGGVSAMKRALDSEGLYGAAGAQVCMAVAQHLAGTVPGSAAELAGDAYRMDPVPSRARWAAFRMFDAGHIAEPAALLEGVPAADASSAAERRKAETIRTLARWIHAPPVLAATGRIEYNASKDSLLVVTAQPLGHPAGPPSVHALETLGALRRKRVAVVGLAAPAVDALRLARQSRGAGELIETVNASRYGKLRDMARHLAPEGFLDEATTIIAAAASEHAAAAICAVSDVDLAMPAQRAARSLGVPFIYDLQVPSETRRTWKVQDADLTERFQLGLSLDAHIAREADHVYVSNAALFAVMVGQGVKPERMSVLRVGVDLRTLPAPPADGPPRTPERPLIVAYAGPIGPIDGLDLLVEAMAHLVKLGVDCEARIVGEGPEREALKKLSVRLGLESQVRLLGQKPSDYALRQLAAADVVVFPRRSGGAFDLVCPIEFIQSMGMGVPVVAANVVGLALEVDDGVSGRLFQAGDADDLARVLMQLAQDPDQARTLSAAGREFVAREHGMDRYCTQVRDDLARLARSAGAVRPGLESAPGAVRADRASDADGGYNDADDAVALYAVGGSDAVRDKVQRLYGHDKRGAASELLRIARLLRESGVEDAELALATIAAGWHGDDATLRAWFWAAQRAKDFQAACDAIVRIEALYGDAPSARQQEMLERLHKSPAYLLTVLLETRPAIVETISRVEKRLCYVLHNTLPYSSGGYATRSQGVAGGIRDAGWEVVVLSRPGFPLDIAPELTVGDVSPVDILDGISYIRTLEPLRTGLSARTYILASADAIEARLRECAPAVVMAASNHVTALPALIAARRLGIPFIYEVRGLWEVTRMSRDANFQETANFHIQKVLEGAVAQLADHVFTLTEPMREELAARGVPLSQIDLLPNSCDPERFKPQPRDEKLAARLQIPADAPVIGYIGTFVDYEGLEDLASACALLKQRGIIFRLMMVGNENASGQERGPITAQIVEIAERAGYSDWLILPGRVLHEEVENYYSLIDAAPFPRKPWPVCEMVSPMKPLEALAMEKAVVVSSVRALMEMIDHQKTGLVFEKGNVVSLADTLERLIADAGMREKLGKEGREWVRAKRTWSQIGRIFSEYYARESSNWTSLK